jgi:hypothetical protein
VWNELRPFLIKTTAACVIVALGVVFTTAIVLSMVEDAIRSNLRGGSAFWSKVEHEVESFAKQEIPPDKKEKWVAIFREMGKKYRPFIDALTEQEPARK